MQASVRAIFREEAAAKKLDPPKPPDNIDPVVRYEHTAQLNDSIISPGETVPDRIKAANSFDGLEYTSLLDHTMRIAVHGRIHYRGASEKIFETRFYWWCFLSDPPRLSRCNTKKWNDHT